MYQFNVMQDESGMWRFELDGINLLLDGYAVKDGKHWINTPSKAIAFFNLSGNLYGVSNDMRSFQTVEDFFDSMREQYSIFKNKHINISNQTQEGSAANANQRA